MGEIRSIPTIGYPVYIGKLEKGFIAQAGCHSRAYETLDQLMMAVRLYLRDPKRIIHQLESNAPPQSTMPEPEGAALPEQLRETAE